MTSTSCNVCPSQSSLEAPLGTRITIPLPDDFHHHVRDGDKTKCVMDHVIKRFGRCMMMPNTKPPIVNTEMAMEYKKHILDSVPANSDINLSTTPYMTLYLTDKTTPEEIEKAYAPELKKQILAVKYYPAGATTNSDYGVTDPKNCYDVFRKMEELGMNLCIHSEVTFGDIFDDREPTFIEVILKPIVSEFPNLKITMEHISTKEAVDYVLDEAPDNVKASITCHHLLYNRNDMLVGGIRPHLYCLPILKKRDPHQLSLIKAATSGSPKFFLGTDSAPHTRYTKEVSCGCAGVYTAHAAIELYIETFDRAGKLELFENFACRYGAEHYGLPLPNKSQHTMTFEKKSWTVPDMYRFGDDVVIPLRAGKEVKWSLVEVS